MRGGERRGLGELLASEALARLVVHFALHPGEAQHVRALQRRSGLSMSSLSRELKRLEARGLVERIDAGGRTLYRAADANAAWKTLRQMVRDFADPAEVMSEALAGTPGIDAAFVFGSFARGDPREDSDVDVLVIGDGAGEVGRQAAEASVLLGRPVEVRAYTWEKLKRQLSAGNAVLQRILAGPKRWLVGDEDRLTEATR